jgi:hypothetical protein
MSDAGPMPALEVALAVALHIFTLLALRLPSLHPAQVIKGIEEKRERLAAHHAEAESEAQAGAGGTAGDRDPHLHIIDAVAQVGHLVSACPSAVG